MQNYNDNQYNHYNSNYVQQTTDSSSLSKFISKTFGWMFVGLAITFGLGMFLTAGTNLESLVMQNTGIIFVAMIAEIVFIFILSFAINKLSVNAARVLYMLYSISMGVALSPILVAYDLSSIIWSFAGAGLMFGVFAVLGYKTKIDLSKIGIVLSIGLLCTILFSLVLFLFSGFETAQVLISGLVLLIFLGFTAYDMQMIKRTYQAHYLDGDSIQKFAIISALNLYLDFINIFIRLLSLFGRARD